MSPNSRPNRHQKKPRGTPTGGPKDCDEIVTKNIDAGLEAVVDEVRNILLKHAKELCTPAVRKTGGDLLCVAKALVTAIRERLEAEDFFGPISQPASAEGA